MQTTIFPVEGMTCNHCVMHVRKALEGVPGVQSVEVSLEKNQATVTYNEAEFNFETARQAVEEAGYRLLPANA